MKTWGRGTAEPRNCKNETLCTIIWTQDLATKLLLSEGLVSAFCCCNAASTICRPRPASAMCKQRDKVSDQECNKASGHRRRIVLENKPEQALPLGVPLMRSETWRLNSTHCCRNPSYKHKGNIPRLLTERSSEALANLKCYACDWEPPE